MKPSFFTRNTCRLCDSGELLPGLALQSTPIGDDYIAADRLGAPTELFNLDLYLCSKCGQVQLRDVVSPELLYASFPYVTSVSVGLPEHFRRFAEAVMRKHEIAQESLVVEIGSNEGPMLRAFQERGCRVLGVEPATAIAQAASKAGVPTMAKYFTPQVAGEIVQAHGRATVIAANNVLANIDDLSDVARGVNVLLSPDGILVMETSYWGDVVKNGLIDTIYHEHLSYFSVCPLKAFFSRHGLELIDVEWNSNKGGSIRLTVQRAGGPRRVNSSVAEQMALERREGIHGRNALEACRRRLDSLTREIQEMAGSFKKPGRSIAGYGASVGTTTMIYEFRLGSVLDYLLDDNPRKHGKHSPGFHIPCVPSSQLEERKPDGVVVFAWRYFDQIRKKHPGFEKAGGRFVIPLPELKII
ncbi:MAG TPA: class I SAM-dependent methyltransferase [Candidatus Angelobacter sp.]|nr:class I SAM-dependent methyltransferase [Candidatus Angelobacter sp.]